jgi:hypothetical protein
MGTHLRLAASDSTPTTRSCCREGRRKGLQCCLRIRQTVIVDNSPATTIPKFDKAAMRDDEPGYTGPDEATRIETFKIEHGVRPSDDLRAFRFRRRLAAPQSI